MRTHNRLASFASILPGLLTIAGSLVISGLPKRGLASAQSAEMALTVKDWTAAGSGCRAQKSKAGDVELKSVRNGSATGSELVVMKFALPKYKLASPPENPATSITFARECALRVVALPKGKVRIKSVAARTPVAYSKDADVGLKMQYLLRLDGEIVGQSLKEIDAGQQIRNAEETVLLSGKPSDEAQQMMKMTPQNCGSAHMLGFDYTFIAARKNRNDAALVQISDEKQLEIAVEIEPCS
ncbi:MAG: hypothetical protein RLZZ488_1805 [Pseudomonadota bacterium]|jgi:hypothetical protein